MPLLYSEIEDYKFNPFTKTKYYTSIVDESHIIPASPIYGAYLIWLYHAPRETVPSSVSVTIGGNPLLEVTSAPGNMQYRIYYDEDGCGAVEFNGNQAGDTALITYQHYGTLNSKAFIDSIIAYVNPAKSCTVTVSTSDSAHEGDYIGDGTSDNVEIQAAIDYCAALPNGGKVILLDGTFNITARIEMKSHVTLEGMGFSSVIKRAHISNQEMIYYSTSPMVHDTILSNLCIHGNGTVYKPTNNYVIAMNGISKTYNNKAYNIKAIYNYSTTITVVFSALHAGLTNCHAENNHSDGTCHPFDGCIDIVYCTALNNTGNYIYGFYGCRGISNCYADYNVGGTEGHGYTGCLRAHNNVSGTHNSHAGFAANVFSSYTANVSYAAADTPAGGFNGTGAYD